MATDSDIFATTPTTGGGWDINGPTTNPSYAISLKESTYLSCSGDVTKLSDVFTTCNYSAIASDARINSVALYVWEYCESGAGAQSDVHYRAYLGPTNYTAGATHQASLGSWALYHDDNMARPGGGRWTYADLATIGMAFYSAGNGAFAKIDRVDQAWLRINWDHEGACFIPLQ